MIVSSEARESTSRLNERDSSSGTAASRPLPLTPLELFLFQCDTPQSPMVIRVVLRMTGEALPDVLGESLQDTLRRHPLVSCRVTGKDNHCSWVAGSPPPIEIRRVHGSVFTSEDGGVRRRINLRSENGLQTEIRIMDDGIKVLMDAHHAVTDGNGLRQIITEWFHLYHCRISGSLPRLAVYDMTRLEQRHQFPQPASVRPIGMKEAIRNLLVTVRGRTTRWVRKSKPVSTQEPAPQSYCAERILSKSQCADVRLRLKQWKVTLNDLMLVSCLTTFAKLAPSGDPNHRVTVLNPTDLRLPSDRTLSAANRFGFAFVRRSRAVCLNPTELLKGIQEEMLYVRSNYIGAEFIKGLVSASRIPGGVNLIRKLGLFVPSMQWTCLGDIARGAKRFMVWKDGTLFFGGLKLEAVSGFAPFAENVPVSVATCEAGHSITLTVQANPQFLNEAETMAFTSALVDTLCSFELPSAEMDLTDSRETQNAK